jgi:hypothetical protein
MTWQHERLRAVPACKSQGALLTPRVIALVHKDGCMLLHVWLEITVVLAHSANGRALETPGADSGAAEELRYALLVLLQESLRSERPCAWHRRTQK